MTFRALPDSPIPRIFYPPGSGIADSKIQNSQANEFYTPQALRSVGQPAFSQE
jgi:hypothetical protein